MFFIRMSNLVCIFSILLSPLISAQIIPTRNIIDVLKYTDEDTDVIFDLDMVIGLPIPHPQPSKRLMLIESQFTYQLVLENIRKIGAHGFVLTARVPEHQPTTIAQLANKGLSFRDLTPFHEGASYAHEGYSITHSAGVVCCGLIRKGQVAKSLFNSHNRKPKRVVFIDDKKSNLEAVELALREIGITDFVGLHYTRVTGGFEFGFLKPITRLYKKHPYIFCLTIGSSMFIPAYFLFKKIFNYQSVRPEPVEGNEQFTRENAVN